MKTQNVSLLFDDTFLRIWDYNTEYLDWNFGDRRYMHQNFTTAVKLLLSESQFRKYIGSEVYRTFKVSFKKIELTKEYLDKNDIKY